MRDRKGAAARRWKTLGLVLIVGAFVENGLMLSGYRCNAADPISRSRGADTPLDHRLPERFLVTDRGYALVGPDGHEIEKLETSMNSAGAISPDGSWLAFSKFEPNPPPGKRQGQLVIQSSVHAGERRTVPLTWGTSGSSFLPLWSSDSKRILICEHGFKEDRTWASSYRVYDPASKSLTDLKLPEAWHPSDWSADGKRLLVSLRTKDTSERVAWVNVDGMGTPEFITSDQEVAYDAKLSPDNRQILCMIRPKAAADRATRTRLFVIELATKKRAMIDRPGHTNGYCWSSDGLKVAYTWQLPLREPIDTDERKTYLVTCDRDGSNHKTVTMRRYLVPPNGSGRGGVIIFFRVLSWWR